MSILLNLGSRRQLYGIEPTALLCPGYLCSMFLFCLSLLFTWRLACYLCILMDGLPYCSTLRDSGVCFSLSTFGGKRKH
jgi:hypothetical protein